MKHDWTEYSEKVGFIYKTNIIKQFPTTINIQVIQVTINHVNLNDASHATSLSNMTRFYQ